MRGARAGVTAMGEFKQARAAVVRVRCPGEIAALNQVRDQLAGRLLGDAEVLGQLSGRGRCSAQPGKAKPWTGRTSVNPRSASPVWTPSTSSAARRKTAVAVFQPSILTPTF